MPDRGRVRASWAVGAAAAVFLPSALASAGGVTFDNVANDPNTGIDYRRLWSPEAQERLDNYAQGVTYFPDHVAEPFKWAGNPGVTLFDHDGDGDVDIFTTNGPGRAHSLYSNQFEETGSLSFVDVAASAGVAATAQDGMGACAGDIDNDGDVDLYVLGRDEPNQLFENLGDGTFVNASVGSGLDQTTSSHISCAMGDVNGDSLLDIVVGNSWETMADSFAIFAEPFAYNEVNQLYVNMGGNQFYDDSVRSGFQDVAEITWAVSMADYDLDGDIDIFTTSDNGAIPGARYGGVDRGFMRVYDNDGQGNFTDRKDAANLHFSGDWMGVSFGDLNCDGYMDMFGTNVGDYLVREIDGLPYEIGDYASRWFLGRPNGIFINPGVGDLVATPFGWGTSTFDYDNDADPDIVFYGSLHHSFYDTADNPGALLENEGCTADFRYDDTAIVTDHGERSVTGVATADLDKDGFVDIVSVSGEDKHPDNVYRAYVPAGGSPFDARARWSELWYCDGFDDQGCPYYYTGNKNVEGTLAVEINSADNGNGSVTVETVGSVGITTNGVANRDGIGAVVFFTPRRGEQTMYPVLGGSSHASQNEKAITFGMGSANEGTIEILWPGGTRNRLYDVEPGERITFPEIPCDFTASWPNKKAFKRCVTDALDELVAAGALDPLQYDRFERSAIKAYRKQ